ncbi:nucleotide exchange factor GrpE [Malaciobacter mytili]|uniref:Protein GrpE n=1 Tax=Malaciobacter mytili LMG 24559 TaxID=1032238 RepID=A0AAX2ADF4_9BACT|nr:nucleotide exchange factor GrpE [Malaciobacter mytili]AXH16104.1 DnaK system nucleotide exchange factor GrpE [Malaciobacter mytili LMG 24559]RXI48796.1 nucleotide exchange factor GrpE [Malaciobacter mytili]RXK14918.1 nucleotide exchange factor GrpE [Malaciobacter mytili LMG 24559]
MSEEKKEELQQEEVVNQEETSTQESSQEVKEETIESVKSELEAKLKEAEDKYLRVHADFENIKKRLEKEKYQAIDYASEKFAKDLLAPIDTLEMALQSANADLSADELLAKLKEGIELTIKNFNTVFEKHDISAVETDGEFDPNFHDAVMQVDSPEHEDGQIVQQLQKGYKFKERLLRPAMVSICKK